MNIFTAALHYTIKSTKSFAQISVPCMTCPTEDVLWRQDVTQHPYEKITTNQIVSCVKCSEAKREESSIGLQVPGNKWCLDQRHLCMPEAKKLLGTGSSLSYGLCTCCPPEEHFFCKSCGICSKASATLYGIQSNLYPSLNGLTPWYMKATRGEGDTKKQEGCLFEFTGKDSSSTIDAYCIGYPMMPEYFNIFSITLLSSCENFTMMLIRGVNADKTDLESNSEITWEKSNLAIGDTLTLQISMKGDVMDATVYQNGDICDAKSWVDIQSYQPLIPAFKMTSNEPETDCYILHSPSYPSNRSGTCNTALQYSGLSVGMYVQLDGDDGPYFANVSDVKESGITLYNKDNSLLREYPHHCIEMHHPLNSTELSWANLNKSSDLLPTLTLFPGSESAKLNYINEAEIGSSCVCPARTSSPFYLQQELLQRLTESLSDLPHGTPLALPLPARVTLDEVLHPPRSLAAIDPECGSKLQLVCQGRDNYHIMNTPGWEISNSTMKKLECHLVPVLVMLMDDGGLNLSNIESLFTSIVTSEEETSHKEESLGHKDAKGVTAEYAKNVTLVQVFGSDLVIIKDVTLVQALSFTMQMMQMYLWRQLMNKREILCSAKDTKRELPQALSALLSYSNDLTMAAKDEENDAPEYHVYLCDSHVNTQGACSSDTGLGKNAAVLTHITVKDPKQLNDDEADVPDGFFENVRDLMNVTLNGKNLPEGLGKCHNLTELKLYDSNLKTLPEDLAQCLHIELLDVSNNRFGSVLPGVVFKITSLTHLIASNMAIESLPDEIGNLEQLVMLHLNSNCLSRLPHGVTKLKKLKSLKIGGIPYFSKSHGNTFSRSDVLKTLKLYNVKDTKNFDKLMDELFPSNFDEKDIVLNEAQLGKFDAAWYTLFPRFSFQTKELKPYGGFPPEVFQLQNLISLSMKSQSISFVPDGIAALHELQEIELSDCPFLGDITSPEKGLANLPLLDYIGIEECPSLRSPPLEIVAKGHEAMLSYMRRLQTGGITCCRTKLMMVGLGGAGKTSLVRALMSGDFKTPGTHGEAITDGIDIANWSVKRQGDENSVQFSVWDFAGQTVYYNTHQYFLSNRAVYMLLWNIRLGYEHAGLEFWLSSIAVHAPKAPIFIVGTHSDQVAKWSLPKEDMMRRYPQIQGFHFISTHLGTGVEKLQDRLIDVALGQDYMGEKIPSVWINFENSVIKMRNKASVVPLETIEELANEHGLFDKSEIDQVIQFLHDLGTLQHFDNPFLRDRVVIEPQWIVDVMSCVVSVKDSSIKDGNFYHKDIKDVWGKYPDELHEWLLRLTEEYDLTFPISKDKKNIVPCLLPTNPPKIPWSEVDRVGGEKESKMIYKFDYLPAGLFNRGQVRLYQYSDSSVIWKKGSLLKKSGQKCLITQSMDNQLIVKVQGSQPENILFMVHEVFEGLIHESFHGVTYDYLMPCPDCLKNNSKDPFLMARSTVRRASELQAPFLQCTTSFHTVSLIDLHATMPPDSGNDYDMQLAITDNTLKDMKKDLDADVFISCCGKDMQGKITPTKIKEDLERICGYKCRISPCTDSQDLDTAMALRDSLIFLVCMSDNYINDDNCIKQFKYAISTLKKKKVVALLDSQMTWKTSNIGFLLSDEVYVNMKPNEYESKRQELIEAINARTDIEKQDKSNTPVFISYCWSNSDRAIKEGSRKLEGAIGHGDPRELKEYIESNGIMCWLDKEQVGKNGLMDDIADGIKKAKIFVACMSDQYVKSQNCMREFHFAVQQLKLPSVMAIVGTGENWKYSGAGIVAITDRIPTVNFQQQVEGEKDKLLKHIKKHIEAEDLQNKKADKSKPKTKIGAFQELYELQQRKFLHRIASVSDKSNLEPYPRLIVADLVSQDTASNKANQPSLVRQNSTVSNHGAVDGSTGQQRPATANQRKDFSKQDYCLKLLCEYEQGWHFCGDPFPAPAGFGEKLSKSLSPYQVQIFSILKHSDNAILNCSLGPEGKEFSRWCQKNVQEIIETGDFNKVYQELRTLMLEADPGPERNKAGLKRCHLPNGKVTWLCEEHQASSRATVLHDTTGHQGTVERKEDYILLNLSPELAKLAQDQSQRIYGCDNAYVEENEEQDEDADVGKGSSSSPAVSASSPAFLHHKTPTMTRPRQICQSKTYLLQNNKLNQFVLNQLNKSLLNHLNKSLLNQLNKSLLNK
ncbi:unnamed protein product [Owenia fusiformis]|uniref:non-specific serine/threonine protein kinase n=1 Tax=Owenia fusiformis TaxID=6347 RepID=A0A8S4Q2L3_OWEFU|nr:unnamed protein product [Owenia fusiformis]